MQDRIGRKTLPHHVPSWVDPATSDYFVTIGCRQRGVNQLCVSPLGEALIESARFYHRQRKWFPELLLLMPDHLHMLVSFGRENEITKVVSAWKRYAAVKLGVAWQDGFFEHRMRAEESIQEKAAYILQNPVRAGLVREPAEWPWALMLDQGGNAIAPR